MGIQVEVKHGPNETEVRVSGSSAAQIQVAGLQGFLNSRLNCAATNYCMPNDSPATKAKCLSDLIQYRFGEVEAGGGEKSSEGAVVRIEGRLKEFATQERVQRLVENYSACRAENHCSPKQGLVERWRCVNTLAQHILQR